MKIAESGTDECRRQQHDPSLASSKKTADSDVTPPLVVFECVGDAAEFAVDIANLVAELAHLTN